METLAQVLSIASQASQLARHTIGQAVRAAVITLIMLLVLAAAGAAASAQEHARISRPPPSVAEAERLTSEMAMNDSLLQRGDIVATDRGFFVFRGLAPDGSTNEFTQVPNPIFPATQAR